MTQDRTTILVIEDEPSHRRIIITQLEASAAIPEVECLGVASYHDAIRDAKAHQGKIDCIVADIRLKKSRATDSADRDGLVAIRTIRGIPQLANVPVILVTRHPKEFNVEELSTLKIFTVIEKPVDMQGRTEAKVFFLRLLSLAVRDASYIRKLEIRHSMQVSKVSTREHGVDVAILCALEQVELQHVLHALRPSVGPSEWSPYAGLRGSAHTYYEASIKSAQDTDVKVIAGTTRHMGLTAAAVLTTQTICHFSPRLIVMVGIAAGVDRKTQGFGDILVADHAYNYMSGKQGTEGGFKPDFRQVEVNGDLARLVRECARDRAFLDKVCSDWIAGPATRPRLEVRVGPLASADQVVDDENRVREVLAASRKLIGLDMETYGVYRACADAPAPGRPKFVSMKSICDFATEKNDGWQSYAAHTSAMFAVHFIRTRWDEIV